MAGAAPAWKIIPGAAIRIRLWPLLAGVSILVVVGLFMLGISDPFKQIGEPTAISMGIMISTLTFALFALIGLNCSWRERKTNMNRVVYWHSTAATVLHVILALYFLSFGIIGLMTWA